MRTSLKHPQGTDPDTEFARLVAPPFDPWDAIRRPSLRNAVVAACIAVALGALALSVVLGGTPRYVSRAALLIDQPQAVASSSDEGVIRKLNLLRLKYVGLIPTSVIAGPLARDLDLPAARIAASTGGYVTGDALVLYTWAADRDPAEARRISTALARRVVSFADDEQAASGIPPDARFRFHVVANAGPARKTDPSGRTAVQAGVAVGLLAAATAYAALQLLTGNRRR
jgi:hypothetical protein